ncbi:MAG: hypothetical protein GF317_23665 [Candidatus Lokiarchaeota archaeon]|nr:hypothetical protein [Candidatus Lokiarchaeota archaeon]MBD3202370.1 hypothetical protein [Candidatus Lokiarchaeota archaeon]
MSNNCENVEKELFLDKIERLSLQIEKLSSDISQMKHKLDKSNKINRSFGLKSLQNSTPLTFSKDIFGIGSPTKRYLLSVRAITEEWKGRKNDFLISIRQQDKETHRDLKSLGVRIPIEDIKNLTILSREILSLLYVSCELKGVEINDILREVLTDINEKGSEIVKEIKNNLIFK